MRNSNYFEIELEKLDKWGEDRRNSLKITLKDLDAEIKELKRNARLAPNLPEKLKLAEEIVKSFIGHGVNRTMNDFNKR